MTESLCEFFRQMQDALPPEPRFDRFAVRDMRPFGSIGNLGHGLPLGLLGIPVVVDTEVETGVIELRNGDEVVDRFLLSELRA